MEGHFPQHQSISQQQQYNTPSVLPQVGSKELSNVHATLSLPTEGGGTISDSHFISHQQQHDSISSVLPEEGFEELSDLTISPLPYEEIDTISDSQFINHHQQQHNTASVLSQVLDSEELGGMYATLPLSYKGKEIVSDGQGQFISHQGHVNRDDKFRGDNKILFTQWSVDHQGVINIDDDDDDKIFSHEWSVEETRDFLMFRREIDQNFIDTRNNSRNILWEGIANKMKVMKGYNRTIDQCKFKWKNLVTIYKDCVTMEAKAKRQQFPFFNDLQAIFMRRILRMEEEETSSQLYLDEEKEEENNEYIGEGGVGISNNEKKKRKLDENTSNIGSSGNLVGSMNEMFDEFVKKQMELEMRWMKDNVRREEERGKKEIEWREKMEEERRKKEMEWREKMEALEKEKLMIEKRWREREEQWRMKQEERDAKIDALIDAVLVNKFKRDKDRSDFTTKK